jgi:ketosteroid isomerase-like protein
MLPAMSIVRKAGAFRHTAIAVAALTLIVGCGTTATMSAGERQAIADSISRQVKSAYDLSKPNVEQRLLSLYPPSGRVVSAASGQVLTSRDSLAMGIKAFWDNVGVNMREPKWVWDLMVIDVLAPNAAVMTAKYHIPHLTPHNQPHTLGGAWTAVFEKRDGRWYIVQEHLSDLPSIPDSTMSMPMAPTTKMPPGMKMP